MRLDIDSKIGGIKVSVHLDSGIYNVDLGDSGEGKTLMFRKLESYCVANGIEILSVDYRIYKHIKSILNDIDEESEIIMCLDNADLYMNKELNIRLKEFKNALILVSLKNNSKMPYSKQTYVKYDGNTISCGII